MVEHLSERRGVVCLPGLLPINIVHHNVEGMGYRNVKEKPARSTEVGVKIGVVKGTEKDGGKVGNEPNKGDRVWSKPGRKMIHYPLAQWRHKVLVGKGFINSIELVHFDVLDLGLVKIHRFRNWLRGHFDSLFLKERENPEKKGKGYFGFFLRFCKPMVSNHFEKESIFLFFLRMSLSSK